MSRTVTRRMFLAGVPGWGALGWSALGLLASGGRALGQSADRGVAETFPRQDLETVREAVGAAHSDLARVRELVERQPALARASHDWGFGDWETPLGAASHTGRREIAELLLAHGARPTIFSAAMLGQLDVVRAFVAASPGVQRTHGPHGLTLLHHARAGGESAAPVAAFLESLGDADSPVATLPLAPADRDALPGRYRFGPGERDYFEIDVRKEMPGIERPGGTRRVLLHLGELVFFPSGVPTVKIAFARGDGRATQLTVADPEVYLTARRTA